jgi:hypothetical protein
MRKGGEGAVMSRRFFFQKYFEGLSEDTLGISRPTVLPPAVTRLFFFILFYLMKFTAQARFDNHGSPTS